MNINTTPRIIVSFLFVLGLVYLGYWLISSNILPPVLDHQTEEYKLKEIADKRQTQYRFAYNVNGDKTQIIHLNKGPSLFEMYHEGTGMYLVELFTPQDSLVEILADVNGKWEGYKNIEVPETGPYLLTVKTSGVWGLDYK